MSEIFKNVPQIKYEGKATSNPFAFRFFNPDEMINGKPMKDHLRFAMTWWHTLCGEGADMFGPGSAVRDHLAGKTPIEAAKARIEAGFELMEKLNVEYFCFHDRDIAPEQATLEETNKVLDEIVAIIKVNMKKYNKKLLWGTANLFGNPRFMHGAGTSCNADVFAYAGAQVKKALEITKELGGEGYVFWGGREGYETLLNTDMGLELDNLGRFLNMAVDYANEIGFKGDFYIEPKPKEPTKHQYDFDVSTVIAFLRKYNLDKTFKFNVEANHATLAGHTFQHELCMARINGMFGSIDANRGDLLLGWDTDQFPTDVYDATMCMIEVIKNGGFTKGGLNFDAKVRRASFESEDLFHAYISGMDAFALGYKIADAIIKSGELDKFVEDRYSSYKSGIGADIVSGKAKLKELEAYALKMGEVTTNKSGRQEYLESIVNKYMFSV